MKEQAQKKILNIILIFILLQPIFDILSRLAILDYIPNISTYVKPLFVFGISGYLLFKYSNIKKKWYLYITIFALFMISHLYLLYKLLTPVPVILHEARFMINIAYMIALYIGLYTLYNQYTNKEEMLRKIKNTVLITFILYFVLYLLAVVTGTSGMTYEVADKNKLGFKGWYDSGQILGHAFSIMFPVLLYTILKPKTKKILRVLFLSLALIVVSLLGTKVPYFITIVVLILYLIIVLGIKIFNKDFKQNWFNFCLVFFSLLIMIVTYRYTPVAYNTNINYLNSLINVKDYNLDSISGSDKTMSYDDIIKTYPNEDVNDLVKYATWSKESSDYLETLFRKEVIHPSDTRAKQFFYSYKKYSLSSLKYKMLGIGFLNQDSLLSLEGDFFMALFNFGIIGFLLFLYIPLKYFFYSIYFILKHLKNIDLETYMIFMGLGIFFCISIYAGYTYIYTNFSCFLVLLLIMLQASLDVVLIKNPKKIKNITFLSLHLGYGGIESATINSANALSDKYNIEIVSFYNLKKNAVKNIKSNIKITYLYNGEPNKEKIIEYLKNKKYFLGLIEGFKAFIILLKKKFLVIRKIIFSKNDAIVSTRMEFNLLLNKYGKKETLKIAQEHQYHNNNKKYLRHIRNDYNNIDYLCALTTCLKEDYEKLLINNNHTKVVLLPNMLVNYPKEKSNLDNKNIITVSRLDIGKRNNEIMKIFSKIDIPDSKLYIIGDGKEYNNLLKLKDELSLKDNVLLTGYLSHNEISSYMLSSSVFLMASITEGLPMVLLEAMSYGIPCIAYFTPSGTGDIIKDGYNGYLIKDRNETRYIKCLKEILNNKELRKEMGENAVKTANKFSKENILIIWENILNRR